ncbi:MAG: hypothetical protein RL113_1328 [Pseudomonadota bacterium]
MRVALFVIVLSLQLYALPSLIVQEIRKSRIPESDISIYIKEAGEKGKVIASLNAEVLRTPASIIKILPTYASLLQFGFDYRWPTEFYTAGTLYPNGRLDGDLVVKGYGDPTLNDEDLDSIITQFKERGLKQINGNIIIDRSYFQVGNKDSAYFDENPYSAYNALPDAMMFNERLVTVCVTPRKRTVTKKYADESYKVIDRLQIVNKPCTGRYNWPQVRIDTQTSTPTMFLQGQISNRCGERNICKVITKPYKSFYYALKERLKRSGIYVKGRLKLTKTPQNAKILFTHYSKSLEEIVSETSKESNNLYARHLMLHLGTQKYDAPATLQKGRNAIAAILRKEGALDNRKLRIDNGCGLSRISKLRANRLAGVLDSAYDRYGKRWMETLSIAGVDGTIKRRFLYQAVKGHAWMKTGTLKHVKNISGYVENKAGKLYTVVIMIQNARAASYGAKLQDEILKWLAKSTAKPGVDTEALEEVSPRQNTTQNLLKNVPKKPVSQTVSSAYYIQAGVFNRPPNQAYLSRMKTLNLPYNVVHQKNYKVLIGGYQNEKEARLILQKVRANIEPSAFLIKL